MQLGGIVRPKHDGMIPAGSKNGLLIGPNGAGISDIRPPNQTLEDIK